ncbi:hypothetical protein ACXR0O_15445 [Verrucomicrobiota bacterium sgz303538]
MKNHIIDITIGAEDNTAMATAVTTLTTKVANFGIHLDDAQRKHSQKMGTRNETFAREMVEFARQHPNLVPAGIDFAAIERDLTARDQLTALLFNLKALTRTVEDTHTALGVDLFNGTRGMYKAVKPIALINGVQDIISRIGQRFEGQGKRKAEPALSSTTPSGV